ncbi:MAG: CbiX/SirB N-terminal domain-containing protein [Burkholderiaceae bacterium]
MTKQGLLLIAHGSKDAQWKAPFEAIEHLVGQEFSDPTVLAYLESATPAVPEGIATLVAKGAVHITVAPLFFAVGSHVRKDIPELIDSAVQKYPQVCFEVLPAIGLISSLQRLISHEIASQASREVIPCLEQINEDISIAGQLEIAHVSRAVNLGFKSIICNRPDEEEGERQTPHHEISAECARLGLRFEYLPVSPSDHTEQDARDMSEYVFATPKPVLIYCRSGRRSKKLLAYSEKLFDIYHPESFA